MDLCINCEAVWPRPRVFAQIHLTPFIKFAIICVHCVIVVIIDLQSISLVPYILNPRSVTAYYANVPLQALDFGHKELDMLLGLGSNDPIQPTSYTLMYCIQTRTIRKPWLLALSMLSWLK